MPKTLNEELQGLGGTPEGIKLLPKLALGFAEHFNHLTDSEEALNCLEVVKKFIDGKATRKELKDSVDIAYDAAEPFYTIVSIQATYICDATTAATGAAYVTDIINANIDIINANIDSIIIDAITDATIDAIIKVADACNGFGIFTIEKDWQLEFLRNLIKGEQT